MLSPPLHVIVECPQFRREIAPAGIDLPAHHKLDQMRQKAAHRRGAAEQVLLGEEQLLAIEFDAMRRRRSLSSRRGGRRRSPAMSIPACRQHIGADLGVLLDRVEAGHGHDVGNGHADLVIGSNNEAIST